MSTVFSKDGDRFVRLAFNIQKYDTTIRYEVTNSYDYATSFSIRCFFDIYTAEEKQAKLI